MECVSGLLVHRWSRSSAWEGAEAIILRKLEDEKLRKTEVRMHPEAPTCEGLMQFLTLNMEKEVDSTETCVNRLYEAAEQADSGQFQLKQ